MRNRATIKAILNRGNKLSDGRYPIAIQVTKDGKQLRRRVEGLSCLVSEWSARSQKVIGDHPRLEEYNEAIRKEKRKFEDIEEDLLLAGKEITANAIVAAYDKEETSAEAPASLTVLEFFWKRANQIEGAGTQPALGNAQNYRNVANVFQNFLKERGEEKIRFSELTYNLLVEWRSSLPNRAPNTLYNYFKTLRALYNEAYRQGYAPKDSPFDHFKLDKFKGETHKLPISRKSLYALEDLDLRGENKSLIEAQKFATFSFYAGGMNFVDIANLKWENLYPEKEKISYTRHKTGRKRSADVFPEMWDIIEYFRPQTENQAHIFPILDSNKHLTARQKKYRVQKVRTRTNKALKELAERIGLSEREVKGITTYTFRHGVAQNLQEEDEPEESIRTVLDQKNEKQTREYLENFDERRQRNAMAKLSRKANRKSS